MSRRRFPKDEFVDGAGSIVLLGDSVYATVHDEFAGKIEEECEVARIARDGRVGLRRESGGRLIWQRPDQVFLARRTA